MKQYHYLIWCLQQELPDCNLPLVRATFIPKGTEYVKLTQEEFDLFIEQITCQQFYTWFYVEVSDGEDGSMESYIAYRIKAQREYNAREKAEAERRKARRAKPSVADEIVIESELARLKY